MTSAATQLGERVWPLLKRGPRTSRELMAALCISQPKLSRALHTLGPELLRIGAARSIQYALLDAARHALRARVYRVSSDGQLRELGRLITVCPEGFVMVRCDGTRLHS